jgi:hypothetical protein
MTGINHVDWAVADPMDICDLDYFPACCKAGSFTTARDATSSGRPCQAPSPGQSGMSGWPLFDRASCGSPDRARGRRHRPGTTLRLGLPDPRHGYLGPLSAPGYLTSPACWQTSAMSSNLRQSKDGSAAGQWISPYALRIQRAGRPRTAERGPAPSSPIPKRRHASNIADPKREHASNQ